MGASCGALSNADESRGGDMVGDFVLDEVDLTRLMVYARSAVFKRSEEPVGTRPEPTSLPETCEP